jgi:ribosomal protein S18 acetylase RimI-like enzyme
MVVALRPMTPQEYDRWRGPAVDAYAQSFVDSGILTPDEAAKRSRTQFAELLGEGLHTAEHHLWTAFDGDDDVGMIWLKTDESASRRAYIYDIQVWPHLRRRGYARGILTALIDEARALGARSIGLNVFASNPGARSLYEQVGFEVTSTQMQLRL